MIVAGSTYAFTLVLLIYLLGIGAGSWLAARTGNSPRRTAAQAALAQGVVAVGAALVLASVPWLPEYVVRVFQSEALGAAGRLALLGGAVSAVVLVPAVGMGMTFPLLTDLVAREGEARSADVGRAYALNTIGSIAGTVLTGFVLIALWGTQVTLRLGVVVSGTAAVVLALGAALGAPRDATWGTRGIRLPVLGAAFLAGIGLTAAGLAPRWDTAHLDLGPAIYGRSLSDSVARRAFLEHRSSRQVAFVEGRNATISVWDFAPGRALKVNGKVDASDHGDMDTQVMLGVAPLAARSNPRTALVIGYGSGVTARVVAAVPGVERVRVLEIEPAVIAASQFFIHVNQSVLTHPVVTVVTDDARSALQLDRARYDVIVSEPSNPWFAGVATLYTPEFFRIVRARLAADGVFCQWVQTYQLPLGVVGAIVGNVRRVFPHTEVWFGGVGDVIVLGSSRPFEYDLAWLNRLLGPQGVLGDLVREYLGVDDPAEYFGRRLLRDSGAARLAALATVVHADDRPELEFVAARRFLDMGQGTGAFDTLVALGPAGAGAGRDAASRLLLAKVLSGNRWDPAGLPHVEAARRLEPRNPYWTVQTAGILLARGEAGFADTALPRLAARGDPDALLVLGAATLKRDSVPRARRLLERALAAGADTAEASAELAAAAAREGNWPQAAARARTALAAARGTLRHPYPARGLNEAFTRMAMHAPPDVAESVLAEAAARRPNSAAVRERYAVAALRTGDCATGLALLLELEQFGIQRPDGPSLVERCRRGEPF
jgi:spermidine synthase